MGMFSQIGTAVERDLVWRKVATGASACPGVRCGGLHWSYTEGVEHAQVVAVASEPGGTPVLRVLVVTWAPTGGQPVEPDIWLESYNGETCDFDREERNFSLLGPEGAYALSQLLFVHGGEGLANALWAAAALVWQARPAVGSGLALEVAR
jgi:hypothetical protein